MPSKKEKERKQAMEELQDASIHHTAAKLINTIKTLKNYEPLYENVQVGVCVCVGGERKFQNISKGDFD